MTKRSSHKRKGRRTSRRKKRGIFFFLKLTKKQKSFAKGILLGVLMALSIIYGRRVYNIVMLSSLSKAYQINGDVGIDISHYQGNVNWTSLNVHRSSVGSHLKSDCLASFVIAKATQGVDINDDKYLSYKKSAAKAGLLFGAYHFFSPDSSPTAQAAHFISKSGLSSGNIIPVLDVERHGNLSASELQKKVLTWLDIVEAFYGKPPIIYCNLSYYTKYFSGRRFQRYQFWIAAYSRSPKGIPNAILWQCTERGKVDGIRNRVDIDIYLGGDDKFKKIIL